MRKDSRNFAISNRVPEHTPDRFDGADKARRFRRLGPLGRALRACIKLV